MAPSVPKPASVTFTMLRPLWLRWWFLTLATGFAAALVFALYRYRVARVLEMAAMRTRIATDLHDDIGANLTRIALLSEVASADAVGPSRDSRPSPASPASRSAR